MEALYKGKHFLSEDDWTREELDVVFERSFELKDKFYRVVRGRPPGRPRTETGWVHEVKAAPGGARSHVLRSDERPGDRGRRAAGHQVLSVEEAPQLSPRGVSTSWSRDQWASSER